MLAKIKAQLGNMRRHWKLFSLIAFLLYLCYRMFISNYILINPIAKLDNYRVQLEDHNNLVLCNQQVEQYQQVRNEANADILQ